MSESLELLAIKEALERIEKLLKEMIEIQRMPPSTGSEVSHAGGGDEHLAARQECRHGWGGGSSSSPTSSSGVELYQGVAYVSHLAGFEVPFMFLVTTMAATAAVDTFLLIGLPTIRHGAATMQGAQ